MTKTRKPKRMEPYTARWHTMASDLAKDYAPSIVPCKGCGGPVLQGYCCTRCGHGQEDITAEEE